MSSQELYLYATNDQQCYRKALSLARGRASFSAWKSFARQCAVKYKREVRNSRYRFDARAVSLAAGRLRRYYLRHVSESETSRSASRRRRR